MQSALRTLFALLALLTSPAVAQEPDIPDTDYPTLPSSVIDNNFCASTANSMGN